MVKNQDAELFHLVWVVQCVFKLKNVRNLRRSNIWHIIFLLAMLTGLLAYKYDKDNEKLMRYLWVIACIVWIINVISDVINLIG